MREIEFHDVTWERLKSHARPLEDTVDDVMNRALGKLEEQQPRIDKVARPKNYRSKAPMLPQKQFRSPLLELLHKLGGRALTSKVRQNLLPMIKHKLKSGDYGLVSTGEVRWWNATCWERNDLVKDGLLRNDSPRGVWELSDEGRKTVSGGKAALGLANVGD